VQLARRQAAELLRHVVRTDAGSRENFLPANQLDAGTRGRQGGAATLRFEGRFHDDTAIHA
jgi:hypothetical protein